MTLHRLFPPRLKPGATVALLSPASPPKEAQAVDEGRRRLEALGFTVRLGRHARSRTGYLAGPDSARARDLTDALEDPGIQAIFFTRGGYGSARLLEHLDPVCFRQHPKIMIGFSDITVLHLACQAQNVVSFWGPMLATQLGLSPFSRRWMLRSLMQPRPVGVIALRTPAHATPPPTATLAEGRLTGGTLTLLAASLGTPYEIETKNRLVFLEDVGEEPYRVDRLLTQLLAAGKLSDSSGIVLGNFSHSAPRVMPRKRSWSLSRVLADRLMGLGLPVISGLPVGHNANQITLPYGAKARLNPTRHTLEILESGVR